MRRTAIALGLAVSLTAVTVTQAVTNGKKKSYQDGGVILRMSEPAGTVFSPGEELSFSYQTQHDAYVLVFNIDPEGYVQLIVPAPGDSPRLVRAQETVAIPGNGDRLLVEGDTGIEFLFAVTVVNMAHIDADELEFLSNSTNLPRDEQIRVSGDPFLAANVIVGDLIRGASRREGVFIDYTYFYVNQRVAYPCYLCGECGGSKSLDCGGFEIASNLGDNRSDTYPLRRAYNLVDTSQGESIGVKLNGVDLAEYDDGRNDVNINFYPYESEVSYLSRDDIYGWDPTYVTWVWDPFWYDPWACGYTYYPIRPHYSRWGWGYSSHYSNWYFNWGSGYYCSPNVYAHHYGYGNHHGNYYGYGHHYRYDDAYKYKYKRKPENLASYKEKRSSLRHGFNQDVYRGKQKGLRPDHFQRPIKGTRGGKPTVIATRPKTKNRLGKPIIQGRPERPGGRHKPYTPLIPGTRSGSGKGKDPIRIITPRDPSRPGVGQTRGGTSTKTKRPRGTKPSNKRYKSRMKSNRKSSARRPSKSRSSQRAKSSSSSRRAPRAKSSSKSRSAPRAKSSSKKTSSSKSSSSRSSSKSSSKSGKKKR